MGLTTDGPMPVLDRREEGTVEAWKDRVIATREALHALLREQGETPGVTAVSTLEKQGHLPEDASFALCDSINHGEVVFTAERNVHMADGT